MRGLPSRLICLPCHNRLRVLFLLCAAPSRGHGSLVIPGQPATVVSYSAEPDFQFVVAMGIFVWFWIMGVYGYVGISTPCVVPCHLFLSVW